MSAGLTKKLVAEAIGVFTLCFIGILAITHGGLADGASSLVTVAFAHGLAIAVMVAALGAVSGAHFNPAVTFGFVVAGRMKVPEALAYWVAQLFGGLLAALIILALFGADTVAGGTPALTTGVSPLTGVVLEAVCTFFLALVVFGSAVDPRAPVGVFPLAIGLTIVAGIMAIGPLTGAALNPARAFGPALCAIGGTFAREGGPMVDQWVYWVGPLIGGALAGLVYEKVLRKA